jgi:hypothetical protein
MFGVEQEAFVLVNINGCRLSSNSIVSHYAMALPTAVSIRTLLPCDLRGIFVGHTEFYSNSLFFE